VFARLVLILVLAVAAVTGRGGSVGVVSVDAIGVVAEVGDGEPMEGMRVDPARVPVPTRHVSPLVLQGTEVGHASPEPARVFRPPRASFV
jgi:hypothetical protein